MNTKLEEIGKLSLSIIEKTREGKTEIWENAIKINQLAREIHDTLINITIKTPEEE